MKLPVIASLILISSLASASTFVGNGGNVGDVELQTTISQLSQIFTAISQNEDDVQKDLCVCTKAYEGRPLCDILKTLNAQQVQYCSKFLQSKSEDLAAALKKKDQIRFSWTHEPMEVKEGGHLRAVDAVTNMKDMSMTLNQKSYLEMTPGERAFLMGHEVFHLTTFESAPMSDEGAAGPFLGADGKRRLINAMAASLVMTGNDLGIFRASLDTLSRSKASKDFWLGLAYDSFTPGFDSENPYALDRIAGYEISARYQFDPHWGALLEFKNLQGTRKRLTQIEGNESRDIVSAGLAYRLFPNDNPLTFWGQSHAVFSATVDRIQTKYKLRSAHTGLDDASDSTGFTVGARYYVPFNSGLWGYAGFLYSQQNLKLPQLLVEYTGGPTATLGVSYGF